MTTTTFTIEKNGFNTINPNAPSHLIKFNGFQVNGYSIQDAAFENQSGDFMMKINGEIWICLNENNPNFEETIDTLLPFDALRN